MAYTIFNANGTSTTVPDNAISAQFYDATSKVGVQLAGKGSLNYGSSVAQNFLQLLENFAGTTTPGGNGATAPVGMIWYDTTAGALKVQVTPGTWSPLLLGNQNITISGDASGSGTTSIPLTLNNITTPGIYTRVTVNSKGLVTEGEVNDISDWNTLGAGDLVVGQLGWKALGDGHSIFDASEGFSPDGTPIDNIDASTYWSPGQPSLMGWDGIGTFGVRVDASRIADTVNDGAPGQILYQSASGVTAFTTAGSAGQFLTSTGGGAPAWVNGVSSAVTLTGDITGTGTGTINTALANTGVTAGTYKSVTVNAKGQVLSGTNPSTLAGYGIVDAAPINSPAFTGTPQSGYTPPIYTVDGHISNTAYVYSMIGNRKYYQSAISNENIPTTLAGYVIGIFVDGVVLPATSSLPNGASFFLIAANQVSVNASGADVINYFGGSGGSVASVLLPAGEYLEVIKTPGAWSVIAGVGADSQMGRLVNIVSHTSSGSYAYTPGAGIKNIIVEVVGGGGGSGGTHSGDNENGVSGGGSPGAYAKTPLLPAPPPTVITVGSGGTAGAVGSQGGDGGTSSFGATLSCPGGGGSPAGAAVQFLGHTAIAAQGDAATPPSGSYIFASYGVYGQVSVATSYTIAGAAGRMPSVLGLPGAGAVGATKLSFSGNNGGSGQDGAVIVYEFS